jgi:hypothetical protein
MFTTILETILMSAGWLTGLAAISTAFQGNWPYMAGFYLITKALTDILEDVRYSVQ